jgi:hypothetical protein
MLIILISSGMCICKNISELKQEKFLCTYVDLAKFTLFEPKLAFSPELPESCSYDVGDFH